MYHRVLSLCNLKRPKERKSSHNDENIPEITSTTNAVPDPVDLAALMEAISAGNIPEKMMRAVADNNSELTREMFPLAPGKTAAIDTPGPLQPLDPQTLLQVTSVNGSNVFDKSILYQNQLSAGAMSKSITGLCQPLPIDFNDIMAENLNPPVKKPRWNSRTSSGPTSADTNFDQYFDLSGLSMDMVSSTSGNQSGGDLQWGTTTVDPTNMNAISNQTYDFSGPSLNLDEEFPNGFLN